MVISVFVLDHVLKLWIELIKSRMPEKSSIEFSGFEKLTFSVKISKFSKILEKITILSWEALLRYELSEREPG